MMSPQMTIDFAALLDRVRHPRVLSLGGGLDSWAMLLECVRRGVRLDAVVFVDVGAPGDPGEWPSTYRHINEVVRPFCARHGIEFVQIDHTTHPVRDARSLFAWLSARKQIPVAGPARICTRIAKVERFEKWLDERYAGCEVEVLIGFEAGEESRAAKDPNAGTPRKATGLRHRNPQLRGLGPVERVVATATATVANGLRWLRALAFAATTARRINWFPLIEWGLCRCRCEAIARASGYPVPRKSACVFCPYGSRGDWQTFAVELPGDFRKVVQMEADKPITGKGKKLSIMAYDSRTQTGTPLPRYVAGSYTRKPKPCGVCGAADRASKASGCTYLPETN